jgi:benzoyl-CoA reductase subunit C
MTLQETMAGQAAIPDDGLLSDRTRLARAFKARGGHVVGFMSNSVPVELIHAAGCFPLQLPATPRQDTSRADRYMEEQFDPMARSVFDQLLRQELDFVDLLVLPRAVDSFQRMYYYLCELRRTGAEVVPEAFLYDVLQYHSYSSGEYSHARTLDLQVRLETLAQRSLNEADLHSSIALYNRIRAKLGKLIERRRSVPCRLAGTTALDLFTASQLMPPDAFEATLDALLATDGEDAPGKRVLLIGSAHDQPLLHAKIARAGGQVVGDYHWRGELLFGPPVDTSLPPLRALSTHYHRDTLSPRSFPAPVDALAEFARAANAEGAIFYYYAEEEALTWDCVEQRQALSAMGVPSLCLSMQTYPPSVAVDTELEQFFARLGSRTA